MRRILSLLSKRTSVTTIGLVDHISTLSSLSTTTISLGGVASTSTSTTTLPTIHSSTQIISKIGTFQPQRSFGTDATDKKRSVEEYLNSLSPARKKFLEILSEYKANNFDHATPTRFVKMIVKAVDSNQDGVITMEGTFYLLFRCSHHVMLYVQNYIFIAFLSSEYSTLLKNIGASDKMTQGDLDEIFTELGDAELNGEKVISVKSIEADSLLKEIWRK